MNKERSDFNKLIQLQLKKKVFHILGNVGNESIGEYELNDIQNAYSEFTPPNAEIKAAIRMIPEKKTNCKRGGEYCILLYSEKKDVYIKVIQVNNSTFILYPEISECSGLKAARLAPQYSKR